MSELRDLSQFEDEYLITIKALALSLVLAKVNEEKKQLQPGKLEALTDLVGRFPATHRDLLLQTVPAIADAMKATISDKQ